jgi:hypothetical protein
LLAIEYNYGFRKGELVGSVRRQEPGLRVHQVNLKDRTIGLLAGKTENSQRQVLDPDSPVRRRKEIRRCSLYLE